jgi:hypothetical protein
VGILTVRKHCIETIYISNDIGEINEDDTTSTPGRHTTNSKRRDSIDGEATSSHKRKRSRNTELEME